MAFVDGQNLYRSAKTAFGYHYPNYDDRVTAQRSITETDLRRAPDRSYPT
jgi:hypothetical protein